MIRQIDGDGVGYVEQWKLHNAWIKDFKFGKLDYNNDNISDITLSIKYDWATLETLGNVDGAGKPTEAAQKAFERNWPGSPFSLGSI